MSTHNICFRQEIRKILCGYPFLSVAMKNDINMVCLNKQIVAADQGLHCWPLIQ